MEIICDIETNALINPDKLWVIVCIDIDTEKEYIFKRPDINNKAFIEFANQVDLFIGHNFIDYDAHHIKRLINYEIPLKKILDTLIVSRSVQFIIPGGHSLDAWGQRLKEPKTSFSNFSEYSEEMVSYCLQDCKVNLAVYKYLKKYIDSKFYCDYIQLQHDFTFIIEELKTNGFAFDKEKAQLIYNDILLKLNEYFQEFKILFPPKYTLIKEITPSNTKQGVLKLKDFRWLQDKDLSSYTEGATFSLIEQEEFNPGSPKQRIDRLWEAKWKPTDKTKGHIKELKKPINERTKIKHFERYGWKTNEVNLETLPENAPEGIKTLVKWLTLDSRRSTLEEWFKAYNEETKSIHGNFNSPGAWSQRLSHNNPNMANVPTFGKLLGKEMRSLWRVADDELLIGVDADSIQFRIFAHYVNDSELTKAIVSGNKENETDAHNLHKRILGSVCQSREDAKTFIYAWILGAGIGKIAEILKCSLAQAKISNEQFLHRYPSLIELKSTIIPQDARFGAFLGLDNHYVVCNNEHKMLAGYLQNGEALIMMRANLRWHQILTSQSIPFKQVNFVHDEWQTKTTNNMKIAKHIAKVQIQAIEEQGQLLNLNCPLAGSSLIGHNWSETH